MISLTRLKQWFIKTYKPVGERNAVTTESYYCTYRGITFRFSDHFKYGNPKDVNITASPTSPRMFIIVVKEVSQPFIKNYQETKAFISSYIDIVGSVNKQMVFERIKMKKDYMEKQASYIDEISNLKKKLNAMSIFMKNIAGPFNEIHAGVLQMGNILADHIKIEKEADLTLQQKSTVQIKEHLVDEVEQPAESDTAESQAKQTEIIGMPTIADGIFHSYDFNIPVTMTYEDIIKKEAIGYSKAKEIPTSKHIKQYKDIPKRAQSVYYGPFAAYYVMPYIPKYAKMSKANKAKFREVFTDNIILLPIELVEYFFMVDDMYSLDNSTYGIYVNAFKNFYCDNMKEYISGEMSLRELYCRFRKIERH